jgi:hypothetical protein
MKGGAGQMDESELRAKAREAIRSRRLPNRAPERMWGGPGVGASCVICDTPVKRDEVEFELEFAPDGGDPDPRNYHVHVRCFAAWEFERPVNSRVLPVLSNDGTMADCERDTISR